MSTATSPLSGTSAKQSRRGIVIGYDGSPGSRLALEWAVEAAQRDDRPLTLLHGADLRMTPGFVAYDRGHAGRYDESGQGVLGEAVEVAVRALDRSSIHALTVVGNAAAELVDLSEDADLVVVGCRGHGALSSGLLGSTSYAVTAHARCPVVVVRGPSVVHAGPGRPIVVAYDDSPHGRTAIELAIPMACAAGAALHVVTVENVGGLDAWPETDFTPGREEMRAAVHDRVYAMLHGTGERLRAEHPRLEVHSSLLGGASGPAIARYAQQVDAGLVVMGSRGRGGFTGLLLGSVSHRVIHDATCPVMVVH